MPGDKYLYLTTPVFYPNDKPHLGHAFTVVLADCLKRYFTTLGYKCWLSVGTDEHGEKIYKTAESSGVPVEEFIEGNVTKFKNLWADLGIKYDRFMRTSDYAHKFLVRKIFEKYEETNQIFFDDWKGWYCPSCEEGYSFRSIGKTAVCKLGHPLVEKSEETYFLRVRAFKSWLLKEYQDRKDWIYPEHYKKEMINNFVNDLDDLSITRSTVTWGIKAPSKDNQTIYVWFDALISYLSALNFGNYGKIKTQTYDNFWANEENSKVIHVIGKEICRFHSIYWPIMLQNLNLRLFDTLLVHGWLMLNNDKMSKSKKNVIDPHEVIQILPREALRLYLLKMNFLIDNHVNIRDIYNTYNSYLANNLGNLISRFYGIMNKKFELKLPTKINLDDYIEIDQLDIQITTFLEQEYEDLISKYSLYLLIEKVFDMFRTAGKLIEKNRAWELEAGDELLKTLVCTIYRLLCIGTWALSPILIDTSTEIAEILNISHRKWNIDYLRQRKLFIKKQINNLDKVFFPRINLPEDQ